MSLSTQAAPRLRQDQGTGRKKMVLVEEEEEEEEIKKMDGWMLDGVNNRLRDQSIDGHTFAALKVALCHNVSSNLMRSQ